MSKYCRPMGLYVTYLDCMECEDKECMTKLRKGEQEDMKKVCFLVDIGTELFLVFASKREGYKDNIVVKCRVAKATVYEKETIYS